MQLAKNIGVATLLSCSLSTYAAFDNTPPTTGAYDSGNYRNMFSEIGKSGIDSKVNSAVNKFFSGSSNEKLYYTFDSNEAYIKDVHSNDVRSEGMSWGLTIAVMANKKSEFDKLWRFMHDRMKNTSGSFPGTFAWSVGTNGVPNDTGPAPDGELYTAFALFNAHARWGSASSGVLDYEQKANDVLDALRNHLMDPYEKQIIFSPNDTNNGYFFTDTSYHIPAFYDYFADMADSNNSYWTAAATESRDFLKAHYNNSSTSHGLASYLAHFDGSPAGDITRNGKAGNTYDVDAWRVVMNVGMDAHLSGAANWHKNVVNGQQAFFAGSTAKNNGCSGKVAQYYTVWGGSWGNCGSNNWPSDIGQTSTLAAGSFAATNSTRATNALNALWNGSYPTGTYRYYPGSLYVLAMLQASGKFKAYTTSSGGGGSTSSSGSVPQGGQNNLSFENKNWANRCLHAGGTGNNSYVNLNTCNGSNAQSMDMKSLSGHIRIDFDNSGQSLGAGPKSPGNRVRTYSESSHNNRRVQFIPSGSHFQIKSVTNGMCIEATWSQTKWQTCNSTINKQLWSISGGGGGSSCISYTYGSGLKNLEFTSSSGGCVDIVGNNMQSSSNFYIGKRTDSSCTMNGTATGNSGGSKNINSGWMNMTGSLYGNKLTVAVNNGCKKFRMRIMP